jgi:hypothetical protein
MAKSVLETIKEKYARKETIADEYGRIIIVKPLTTSQQVKVREMAGNGDPGVIGILTLAASIVSIDEIFWPFPKDRKELDMSLDVLDEKGLEAVAKAYEKFNEKAVETEEAAKNLAATDSSAT